uniref:Stathmin n=1 Tax=Timema cristinae TaxID=61476 RepID=A0A7R9CTS4_TIMCR|nr:unnamed protein product [Timema cristinae]
MKSKQFVSFVCVATEIRCQEKSKGGLAYEVILADPVTVTPPKRPSSPSNKNVSVENIEEKLKAAEERRLAPTEQTMDPPFHLTITLPLHISNLEANRMAQLAVKMSKIEEASKKKDDQAHQFISQTREALEQKMETHEEKREAYISDLKAKLKDHLETVEKTRQSLEAQTEEVRTAVEEKLKTAAAQRDENIKKMLDRLKEHEENVKRVRSTMQEKVTQLESQIQNKLTLAQTRRKNLEQEQLEKLREHNVVKLAEVRHIIEGMDSFKTEKTTKELQERLEIAELNREKELQKKLEKIQEKERRAEMVRQNKERLATQNEEQQTASSG